MYSTTVASGAFLLNSDGYVAGTFQDNPGARWGLEGGVVASAQSTPIYGGQPLTNTVVAPTTRGSSGLGQTVALAATTGANIQSWAVFNQASAGVITPFSNVPLYYAGGSINFIRNGCGLWLVLPVNPTAVNTIAGGLATQSIFWDFTNNRVDTTGTGALPYKIIGLNQNSKTVTFAAGPPITANWNNAGSVIVVEI